MHENGCPVRTLGAPMLVAINTSTVTDFANDHPGEAYGIAAAVILLLILLLMINRPLLLAAVDHQEEDQQQGHGGRDPVGLTRVVVDEVGDGAGVDGNKHRRAQCSHERSVLVHLPMPSHHRTGGAFRRPLA